MRRTPFIIPAVIAFIVASPALAGGEAWQVGNDSFHLTFKGVDLHTATGRAEALAKVETVAGRLCRNTSRLDRDACRADVLATSTRGSAGGMLRTALAERAQASSWALAAAK